MLRLAFETGSFAALEAWYADDAVLESWVTGSCEVVRGGAEIAGRLAGDWEGAAPLARWDAVAGEGGYEIEVQRAADGPGEPDLAQHHLVHVDERDRVTLHLVYPSRPRDAASLDPDVLRELVPELSAVAVLPAGYSGATLYRATLRDGSSVVVKHASPAGDWLVRATGDPGRELLLWEAGVFERLPPGVECPIVSGRRLADGWVIVMRDVEPALAALAGHPSAAVDRIFRAADAVHGVPVPDDPSILCSLERRLRIFSPVRPLVEWRGTETIPKTLTRMWQVFADLPDADVVDAVFACIEQPADLLSRLERLPRRLLHGDVRLPNIGLDGDSVVLIDWALACVGPPELEVAWFVSDATFWCDAEPEELIALWCERSGTEPDGEALDLAFVFQAAMGEVAYLAHELVQRPAGTLRPSPARVAWWLDRVRVAFERTGLG